MGKGKIRVREAKPGDKKLFLRLYKEYLEETKENISSILPTENNLEIVGRLFDAYVNEDLDGSVLLVAQDAFFMCGEQGPQPFEVKLGRIAHGWGCYVRESMRGRGVAPLMYTRAAKLLRKKGFDSIIDAADVESSHNKAIESVVKKVGLETPVRTLVLDLKEG